MTLLARTFSSTFFGAIPGDVGAVSLSAKSMTSMKNCSFNRRETNRQCLGAALVHAVHLHARHTGLLLFCMPDPIPDLGFLECGHVPFIVYHRIDPLSRALAEHKLVAVS